jgi:hypothetical protein
VTPAHTDSSTRLLLLLRRRPSTIQPLLLLLPGAWPPLLLLLLLLLGFRSSSIHACVWSCRVHEDVCIQQPSCCWATLELLQYICSQT